MAAGTDTGVGRTVVYVAKDVGIGHVHVHVHGFMGADEEVLKNDGMVVDLFEAHVAIDDIWPGVVVALYQEFAAIELCDYVLSVFPDVA